MANPSAAFEPKAYSVAFEMQLLDEDLDRGRKIYFNRANAALDNAMKANPDFCKNDERHDEGPVSVKLADSFEEFIAGLSVDPDNI